MATVHPFKPGSVLAGQQPTGYYSRFDPALRYDQHLFRADYVLQSAELNEIQAKAEHRSRLTSDLLFEDGAIAGGAALVIDATLETDNATGQAGVIYMDGELREVPEETFTVPLTGTISVGIYLVHAIITDTADTALRDPAVGLQNASEPGAFRLRKTPQWGYEGDPAAPANAAFYGVYTVIDGVVQPKSSPPDIAPINQAIARYDVQSTGSYYVSGGMSVVQLPDDNGDQVYEVQEGIARVGGFELILAHSVRAVYPALPDIQAVLAESHAATADPQTVTLNHSPVATINQVLITKQITTESVTRGANPNSADGLAHTSIVSVQEVKQGGTTYTSPADYTLSGDTINWSPGGAEPAGGTTYTVTYRYTASYPDEPSIVGTLTDTTVEINGAVNGTTVYIGYDWKMPRYDWLCIDHLGAVSFFRGVPHAYNPTVPRPPNGLLALARIHQTWNAATRYCLPAAVRMVPMSELSALERRINDLYALVAETRLAVNITAKDPSAKRGLFVDNFEDADMRDVGLDQTAITSNKTLTLGIDTTIADQELAADVHLDEATTGIVINQPYQTGTIKINPFMGFDPLPAKVILTPTLDFWTETHDTWASAIAQRFYTVDQYQYQLARAAWSASWLAKNGTLPWWWSIPNTRITNDVIVRNSIETLSSESEDVPYLRTLTCRFVVYNLPANHVLYEARFGGQIVTMRTTP